MIKLSEFLVYDTKESKALYPIILFNVWTTVLYSVVRTVVMFAPLAFLIIFQVHPQGFRPTRSLSQALLPIFVENKQNKCIFIYNLLMNRRIKIRKTNMSTPLIWITLCSRLFLLNNESEILSKLIIFMNVLKRDNHTE